MYRATAFALVFIAMATPPSRAADAPATSLVTSARTFLATLTPEQKQRTQFPFDSDERFAWFYTPIARKGLTFKDMDGGQRTAAMSLLRAGLSEKGYAKAETIRALEDVLVEMGGNPRVRDKELYYFSVFGEPAPDTTWGWRYEGHHVSQHWTIVNGKALVTTPQFFGANPAEVRQGQKKGLRALAIEEDLAYQLVESLDEGQRKLAIIDSHAPNDILTSNSRQAAMQADLGVPYARLTQEQQGRLMQLIEVHAGATVEAIAQQRLVKLRGAGIENIKFGWMGDLDRSHGHYYRIQGPTFLIEFDNTQDDANHIHTVWRDFKGDFGRDLLQEHYEASRHR
jgi:hypothetical protein